jgi:hypothetical protein
VAKLPQYLSNLHQESLFIARHASPKGKALHQLQATQQQPQTKTTSSTPNKFGQGEDKKKGRRKGIFRHTPFALLKNKQGNRIVRFIVNTYR